MKTLIIAFICLVGVVGCSDNRAETISNHMKQFSERCLANNGTYTTTFHHGNDMIGGNFVEFQCSIGGK